MLFTTQVKPLLNVARQEEEMKAKEEELRNAMAKTQQLLSKFKDLEEKMATLSQEKNDLTIQLQAVCGALGAAAAAGGLGKSQTQRRRESGLPRSCVLPAGEFPAFSFFHCHVTLDPTTKKTPSNSCLPTAAGWAHTHTVHAGPGGLSRHGGHETVGGAPLG